MLLNQSLRINTPLVVSQEIEGEAILIHFDSGCYYSANATGSIVLDLINRGQVVDEISGKLAAAFPEATAEIPEAVASFLSGAIQEGLLVPAGDGLGAGAEADPKDRPVSGPWVAPRLERFDDLQDLLMLDPIHDVDAVGWPVPPPADTATAGPGQER